MRGGAFGSPGFAALGTPAAVDPSDTFGPETETPEVVPFEIDGLRSGGRDGGPSLHGAGPILVRRFEDYVAALERAKVVLDATAART